MSATAPADDTWLHGGLRFGFDRAGAGQPLIFGHGLGGDRSQGAALLNGLTGVERLTLESRGHGGSSMGDPADLTLATFARDAMALAGHLNWDTAVWGGVSMGAAVAMHAAVMRPNAALGLVLVRPAWTTGPAPAHLAVMGMLGHLMRTLTPDAARRALLDSPAYADILAESPSNANSLLGQFHAPDLHLRGMLLQRIGTQPLALAREALCALREIPVLIVATHEDALHPVAVAQDLAAQLPNARLAIVTSKSRDPNRNRDDTLKEVQCFMDCLK